MIESLKNKNCLYVTENAIRADVQAMKVQYEQEHSLTIKRLSNELQNKLMKLSKQQAELGIYENNKEKLERAKKRKDHLIKFNDLISISLLNAELVWALMQLDIHRVKRRNDFDYKLNDYRSEAQICNRRIVSTYGLLFKIK